MTGPEQLSFDGLSEGRALRDEGVEAAGKGADPEAVARWQVAARQWLDNRRACQTWTSDDLAEAIGMPPVHTMLGAWVLSRRRDGQIMPVGYVQSTRPSAHARPIRVWRIKE